ncbi:MAG: hypothetical protein MMC33_007842 [Icmadophila ericetorum]|nr:hypothetical protein [Icmadophila ericetorum]
MGKKRKAGGKPFGQPSTREIRPEDAKLTINSYEDVADSEDDFFIGRDKILLEEGPERKRLRRAEEEDAFLEPSDEEVLVDPEEPSDEDDLDEANTDDYDQEQGKDRRSYNALRESDSEGSGGEDEDEEEAGEWGASKKDYYDANVIETEADALEEEQEALRLQKKHLKNLTEADFGFDEADWLDVGKADGLEDEEDLQQGIIREILPQLEISHEMGPEERTKILATRYPEFQPLAKEFLDLQDLYEELQLAVSATQAAQARLLQSTSNGPLFIPPVASIKCNALAAYLGALSMYFAIFSSLPEDKHGSRKAMSHVALQDHPIMETLMQCREIWEEVKNVPLPDYSSIADQLMLPKKNSDEPKPLQEVSENQATKSNASPEDAKPKRKRTKKSKSEKAAAAAIAEATAKREAHIRQTEEELKKLSTLEPLFTKPSRPTKTLLPQSLKEDNDSDFGEETPQTTLEAARRKKSLGFYTSQIAQKANKRNLGAQDVGGDADIPYRERLKDRMARLNAEAEARGKKKGLKGDPLGGESDEEDHRTVKELRDEVDGDDASEEDYYSQVVRSTDAKKAAKAAKATATKQAALEGATVVPIEEIGPDGKRGITYAIEKNKGLTPKRKKDVRNPRVKKRKKYEDKMKKLGSIRAIYKGGEGRGGYGGELTGIKTDVVKSVKFK